MAHKYAELERLVAERGNQLLAAATLLAGDRASGEDLFQQALERVLRRGRHVRGDPEGYLRRTMYHLAVDRWRSRRRHREVYGTDAEAAVADASSEVDLRSALLPALRRLPPHQRAVVVLRYYEQLSVTDAADALGCSVGTVKSQTFRALKRLRTEVGEMPALRP